MKVSICISSTWIKTNTNQLVQLQHIRGSGGKLAVFLLWRKILITTGKKRYITTRKKKDTAVCLLSTRFLQLRPEKKDTVVCLLGARFWRLRPEKKRYSRLSDGLCCCIVFCSGGKFWSRNFYYDRKKSMSIFLFVIVIFVLVQLELNLIQIH